MGAQAVLAQGFIELIPRVFPSSVFAQRNFSPKNMGGDGKNDHLVPYVNTWFWPSCTLMGTSGLFFCVYLGKITNSHEWKELFLDYCHHKRTVMCPNPLDNIARTFFRILKIAPK